MILGTSTMYVIVGSILLCFVFTVLGYFLRKYSVEYRLKSAENMAEKILKEAEKEANTKKKEKLLEAQDEIYKMKQKSETEERETRKEFQQREKRISQREEYLERKSLALDAKEQEIIQKEDKIKVFSEEIAKKEQEYASLIQEEKEVLERISSMTQVEAKKMLLEKVKKEVKRDAGIIIKQAEEETREIAQRKAQEIISLTIQRCANEQVALRTVSVVDLPNNDIKGRIIGREGRNIRTLEAETGVGFIIDDTPETIVLSSFDPLRREIARISMERLISDGRIHPARIEEVVSAVREEMEQRIQQIGQEAAFDVGVQGLHLEELRLLGKLMFRSSYSQNVLEHSKEVAYMAGIMADELGVNSQIARRAGLLHDIGKAVDRDIEGAHAKIGAEIVRKYNESEEVLHAIAAHHDEIKPHTVIAVLIQAADALSAARPGARRESLEVYLKRLEKLEQIANSFQGVEKAFAIQAGREIRIMVKSEDVDDAETTGLAWEISKTIEKDLEYPGQVKVTVIREVRATEYAK